MSNRREFRASLASYVRESGEDAQLVDQRGRMLESMLKCPAEKALLMERCDLAALLTCVCRPAGEGKVNCQSAEVRTFIDELEKHADGEGFEADLSSLLRYALKEASLAPLVWKGQTGSIAQAVALHVSTAEEDVSAPSEEPGSLFDRRDAATESQ